MSEKSIGALWINRDKNENEYYQGYVKIAGEQHKIVVFRNNNRYSDKSPDFSILRAKKMSLEEAF